MTTFQEMPGQFWLPDTDGPKRPGVLHIQKESAPLLTVHGALTSMMRLVHVSGTGDEMLSRYQSYNDRAPHTIHGLTDDGTRVTILEAMHHKCSGGLIPDSQDEVLLGIHAVIGGQLSGRDHGFSGVRVRMQSAARIPSFATEQPQGAEKSLASGGILRFENDADGPWLVLQEINSRSIRGLDRQYLTPLGSLLTLATGMQANPLEVQLQESEGMPWWPAHSAAQKSSDLPFPHDALLRPEDISPEVLSIWLDQVEKLGPLPPVIATGLSGPIAIEARVLALTTIAEGLHRRLFPSSVRFDEEVGAAIRDAAAEAAEQTETGTGQAVRGFLNFVHEVGYGKRLLELAEEVRPFMPGVAGRTNRWKAAVYDSRNDFAHRTTQGWFEDSDHDKYLTVALSLQWLLRGLLLKVAGIPIDVLAQRFRAHQEYQLFLEQAQTWQPLIYPPEQDTRNS